MIDSMEEDIYEGVKNNDRNLLEELFEVRSKLFYTHLFNVCDFFMNDNENQELEFIDLLTYIQYTCTQLMNINLDQRNKNISC